MRREAMNSKAAEALEMLTYTGVSEERARELLKQVLDPELRLVVIGKEWESACAEYFRDREAARG